MRCIKFSIAAGGSSHAARLMQTQRHPSEGIEGGFKVLDNLGGNRTQDSPLAGNYTEKYFACG
jgi:hypothetical protein